MRDLPQEEILTRALALDPVARSAYLDEACGEDAVLRAELESLLAVADRFPAKPESAPAADPPASTPLPERVGRYPITGVVGAGGMGLVYRARDPALEREVALKRLPVAIQDDPAALARLRREARALARLSHPNIATVYSLESEPTGPFLTMELVPGRSLHAVLADGPLPVEQALWIGLQIAAAMEAAHAEGIIHRDLKPLNIQVADSGEVKVLDFGLAKPVDELATDSIDAPAGSGIVVETAMPAGATGPVTVSGRVVGTPGYISPEQLLGRVVGPPADIWAFGCVLFECLSGASPYHDAAETVRIPARLRRTLAALDLEPDWSHLPSDLPAGVEALLRNCLQTEPDARPSAAEARRRLEQVRAEMAAPSAPSRFFNRRGAVLLACGLVAIVAAGMLGGRRTSAPAGLPTSTVRQLTFHGNTLFSDLAPDGETAAYLDESSRLSYLDVRTGRVETAPLTTGAANDTITMIGARPAGLRWSPSGRELAVVGMRQAVPSTTSTYIVRQGEHRATRVGVADFSGVAWSPDGTRIAGTRGVGPETALCILERASGECRDVPLVRSVIPKQVHDWSAGDQIYFKPVGSDTIFAVPAVGGAPRAVLKGRWLRCLPGRDAICYTVGQQIRCVSLDRDGLPTEDRSVLADRVPDFASPFSLARDGRRVLYDNLGVSEVWLGRRATAAAGGDFRWGQLVRASLSTNAARFSPDGSRIALVGRPVGSVESLLLVHSLVDGSRTTVFRSDNIGSPDWSPDGTELVFRHGRGISRLRLDEDTPRRIPGPRDPMYVRWLPDGRIVYMERDGDLWRAYSQIDPSDGSISRLPIDPQRGTLFQFAMAPDGASIAVAGNREGHYKVKVWLIDLTDGSERLLYDAHAAPFAWSADGRWVYVVTELEPESDARRSRILRVAVDDGTIEVVADLPEPTTAWSNLDLSPDETSLVYTQQRIGRDLWLMDIASTPD